MLSNHKPCSIEVTLNIDGALTHSIERNWRDAYLAASWLKSQHTHTLRFAASWAIYFTIKSGKYEQHNIGNDYGEGE